MRGLFGATLNNYYLLKNHRAFLIYLLVVPALIAAYVILQVPRLLDILQVLLVLGIPAGILEAATGSFQSRWNIFENSWGSSPFVMVVSRYIVFLAASIIFIGIWLLLPMESNRVTEGIFHGVSLYDMIIWSQIYCILFFPLLYMLNPRKTDVAVFVIIVTLVAAIALGVGLTRFVNDMWHIAGIIAASYVVSVMLSSVFNSFHRGKTS